MDRSVVLWAAAGAVIYVLAGLGSLLAFALVEGVGVIPADSQPQAGAVSLSIRNGLHQVAWGALAAAASLPLGRRLVAGLRFRPAGWVVLSVGLALAGITMFLLNELDRSRNGMFDPDHVGFAWFAAPAVIAIALAAWATLATPDRNARILAGTTVLAVSALALALLPSLPGAADGIRADGVPLVGAFLADVGFAVLATMLVVRKVVAQPSS
jgi:hypothetical protein